MSDSNYFVSVPKDEFIQALVEIDILIRSFSSLFGFTSDMDANILDLFPSYKSIFASALKSKQDLGEDVNFMEIINSYKMFLAGIKLDKKDPLYSMLGKLRSTLNVYTSFLVDVSNNK